VAQVAAPAGVEASAGGWSQAGLSIRRADLVVSTVPAGAADDLVAQTWGSAALFDVLYAPWPTPLAVAARAAGAAVVGGLPMLVGQAALAVELMTGRPAPLAAMRAAGERALTRR
jgi:shikimate dehydrogenase